MPNQDHRDADVGNAAGYPRVQGRCPTCGSTTSLFLGEGGYVTCSWIMCSRPDHASAVLDGDDR